LRYESFRAHDSFPYIQRAEPSGINDSGTIVGQYSIRTAIPETYKDSSTAAARLLA